PLARGAKFLWEFSWVRTDDPESDDDDRFFAALQELVAYAFEESVRIKKTGRLFPGGNARKLRTIHERPGNIGQHRTAWWSREDSNCLPGTQSIRTCLCVRP